LLKEVPLVTTDEEGIDGGILFQPMFADWKPPIPPFQAPRGINISIQEMDNNLPTIPLALPSAMSS